MLLKQAIEEIGGLKYMTNLLNVKSSAGRRYLYTLPFLTKMDDLKQLMTENELFLSKWRDPRHKDIFSVLANKLSHLRDINTTLKRLAGHHTANDIELFEIKYFAVLSEYIRGLIDKIGLNHIVLPDLSSVIEVLDPEQKLLPQFHIYDEYSDELSHIRKSLQTTSDEDKEQLLLKAEAIEDTIREDLSNKLKVFASDLLQSLDVLSYVDVSLAKAEQADALSLTKPDFSDKNTVLKAVYHPQVAEALKQKGKIFQPIDIDIPNQPTLITGANMAGKSVVLKTVALVQALAQFGFYVPVQLAIVAPVEQIVMSVGDGQDIMNGLSSYASEMLRINDMVGQVQKGANLLVLIDELARTTNPIEGKAIVCGVLDFLIEHKVRSLITTHYSIDLNCRKLRVKGFVDVPNAQKTDIKTINNYMDYSLEEIFEDEVPQEALQIAEIIGVDKELIEKMNSFVR